MRCIGIEIGGTKLQAALGGDDGGIISLRRGRAPAEGGAPAILAWVEGAVRELLEESAANGAPEAIGIGFGGPVESASGRVLTSHQVAGWEDFGLRHWAESAFSLPCQVANDANAAAWAEYRLGAGVGARHFAYMNIGSGIGGGLVLDGRLQDGQGRGAGEIGHTYVPDWRGAPGGAAKLEALCSGWAWEARLRAQTVAADTPLHRLCGGDPGAITCAMLGEAAAAGDDAARAEIQRTGASVGIALANLIALTHPERIAIGGGVAHLGAPLFEAIRAEVEARIFGPYRGRCAIVPCALGEEVVVSGALLLAPRAI